MVETCISNPTRITSTFISLSFDPTNILIQIQKFLLKSTTSKQRDSKNAHKHYRKHLRSIVAAGVRKVMDGREFEKSPSSSAITVFQRGYATTVAQKQSK